MTQEVAMMSKEMNICDLVVATPESLAQSAGINFAEVESAGVQPAGGKVNYCASFKSERLIWGMWSCAAMFYLYQFILRVSPSVMTDELKLAFDVTPGALGLLVSFYYLAYSSFQVPVGILMDRFGPKRLILLASILCAIGAMLFAMSHSVVLASFSRLLMGVGSACGFLGCIKLGSMWFSSSKMPYVVGMTMMIGTTGAVGGGYPLAHTVHVFGWRESMFALAALGGLIALLVYSFVKERSLEGSSSPNVTPNIWENLINIAKNPQTWIIGAFGGLMYIPLSAFADLWGTPFVSKGWGVDEQMAAGAVSLFYVGIAIGGPLSAILSDFYKSHRVPMFVSSVVTGLGISGIILFPQWIPFDLLFFLLFIVGAAASGQFIAFVSISRLNPISATATASGFHNMLCMVSGVVIQPLVGILIDYKSGIESGADALTNSLYSYQFALMSIPVATTLAFFLIFFIKPTYHSET